MTTALYYKVADQLKTLRKNIQEPMRLPAEGDLAVEHRVGRDTIRRALKLLEDDGVVTRKRKRGTYLQPVQAATDSLAGCNIGFVPPWWADSTTAWFTSTLFEGVTQWADQHDCHLNVLHAQRHPKHIDLWLEHLRGRKLAGIVWVHPREDQLPLIEQTASVMPSVVLGRDYPGHDLHQVTPDYQHMAKLIDDHLVSQGHKHYAVIGANLHERYCQTWLDAIKQTQADRGVAFQAAQHFIDIKPWDRSQLATMLLDFYLPVHPGIEAFVLLSSSYLKPLIADARFLQKASGDLSLVTWDYGLHSVDAYWPGRDITHVSCDWPEVGKRAMDSLSMLAAQMDAPKWVKLRGQLMQGQTVYPHSGKMTQDIV